MRARVALSLSLSALPNIYALRIPDLDEKQHHMVEHVDASDKGAGLEELALQHTHTWTMKMRDVVWFVLVVIREHQGGFIILSVISSRRFHSSWNLQESASQHKENLQDHSWKTFVDLFFFD